MKTEIHVKLQLDGYWVCGPQIPPLCVVLIRIPKRPMFDGEVDVRKTATAPLENIFAGNASRENR